MAGTGGFKPGKIPSGGGGGGGGGDTRDARDDATIIEKLTEMIEIMREIDAGATFGAPDAKITARVFGVGEDGEDGPTRFESPSSWAMLAPPATPGVDPAELMRSAFADFASSLGQVFERNQSPRDQPAERREGPVIDMTPPAPATSPDLPAPIPAGVDPATVDYSAILRDILGVERDILGAVHGIAGQVATRGPGEQGASTAAGPKPAMPDAAAEFVHQHNAHLGGTRGAGPAWSPFPASPASGGGGHGWTSDTALGEVLGRQTRILGDTLMPGFSRFADRVSQATADFRSVLTPFLRADEQRRRDAALPDEILGQRKDLADAIRAARKNRPTTGAGRAAQRSWMQAARARARAMRGSARWAKSVAAQSPAAVQTMTTAFAKAFGLSPGSIGVAMAAGAGAGGGGAGAAAAGAAGAGALGAAATAGAFLAIPVAAIGLGIAAKELAEGGGEAMTRKHAELTRLAMFNGTIATARAEYNVAEFHRSVEIGDRIAAGAAHFEKLAGGARAAAVEHEVGRENWELLKSSFGLGFYESYVRQMQPWDELFNRLTGGERGVDLARFAGIMVASPFDPLGGIFRWLTPPAAGPAEQPWSRWIKNARDVDMFPPAAPPTPTFSPGKGAP